jgi:hypothetical protein
MQSVTRYISHDGKEFDNKDDAKIHELYLEMKAAFSAAYPPNVATNRFDSVLMAIADNPVVARDILNGYIRRMPKKEQIAA